MVDLPERFRRELLHVVAQRPEVRRVILYGSRARGDANDRSDIDLAIEAPEATGGQYADLALFLRDESATLLDVDVVRLENAPPELKERILAEGQVIYERGVSDAQPDQPGQFS